MARLCKICNHPEQTAIETAIVSNDGYQWIATRFSTGETSFSESAVRRHKQNCMRAAIQAVQQKNASQTAQVVAEAEQKQEHFVWNLFAEMQWLHQEVRSIYTLAKGSGDYNASSKALGEARQQMKLFSELLAGQEPGQAEKLEAEWIAVREAIFNALEPYPEARLAVARALLALRKNANDHESSGQLLQAESSDSAG